MSAQDDNDILYDPDGNPVAQVVEASDGAIVAVDFDGQIVGAVDTDGNILDPGGYELDGQDDAAPDPGYVTRDELAAFAEQQAQLAAQQRYSSSSRGVQGSRHTTTTSGMPRGRRSNTSSKASSVASAGR